MANLGDFLKSINKSKVNLMAEDSLCEKEYSAFVINRTLSYFPETILYANDINCRPFADSRMQYDYLREIIRPGNRFSRWNKVEKEEKIGLIKRAYGYNNQKARDVLNLLSDDQIKALEKEEFTGGKKKLLSAK